MRLLILVLLAGPAWSQQSFDVLVYGATPGGIGAAIAAARMGRTVALVEPTRHVGGMTAAGLSHSDVITRDAIGGLYREFTARVYKHYVDLYGADSENVKLSHDGYSCEPGAAEKILRAMLAAEPRVKLLTGYRLEDVARAGRTVASLRARDLATDRLQEFHARIFIDGSYEGDLAASAGAAYRVGRESRAEFNEPHAGVIYVDPTTHAILAGTTGQGDRRIGAYTFRPVFSLDPANSYVLKEPPPDYHRETYLRYLDDWKSGRMGAPDPNRLGSGTPLRAFTLVAIPNRKYDANMNPRTLGYPFAEESDGYPEGSLETRRKITERIRNLTLGLLWFLQHDPDIPAEHRATANRLNLALDEFADTGHFPWQLYIREARRIVGLYTLSENDVMPRSTEGRPPIHADALAAGEYPIDSMPMRKYQAGDTVITEGYLGMMREIVHPYQIPYRIVVPRDVEGLLVPVAASTTHLAFSSIRLEPTWMAIGHAAGIAAHLAIRAGVPLSKIDIAALQRELLKQGQVLTYFKDLTPADPSFQAMQFFGTKGFFEDYYARPKDPLHYEQAVDWLKRARPDLELPRQSGAVLTRGVLPDLFPGNPSAPVSRGEFCQALYR